MLYDTMKIEFTLQLFLFGGLALLFAILSVHNAHIKQQFLCQKLLVILCALICIDFMTLFIRVTAPYKNYSDFLLYIFVLLSIITLIVFIYYIKKKPRTKKPLNIDILNFIDDYVLVFDQNCKVVLSTCPKDLEEKANFTKEKTTIEIEFNNEYFIATLSPIIKNNKQIGYVGIFHNITVEKNLLLLLSEKIEKLSEINEGLTHEVNVDNALLIAKQRNKLCLNIQEEIDKKITILIKQIKKLEKETKPDIKINNLILLADYLRLILADIRKIVYGR